jgi:ferredoxin
VSATAFIRSEKLAELVRELTAAGTRVIAPAPAPALPGAGGTAAQSGNAEAATGGADTTYRVITELAEATFNGGLPVLSLKGYFLPASEELFRWRQKGADVELLTPSAIFAPQVILGARPCDAAAVEIVDRVMHWDYDDELWAGRRAATTVFTMVCPGVDDSCFCSAVGDGPASTRGADVLLEPAGDGYHVELVSEKGSAFAAEHERYFEEARAEAADAAQNARAAAMQRVSATLSVDTQRIAAWLDAHFDDDFWPGLGPRCNGCGACTVVCPTCHCFDIVDEPEGVGEGTRRRNWDTCQSGKFTLHASGHNPRGDQNARYRQRINHKFLIYPGKFGDVLCSGCGRCIRACPGGQDLVEILQKIDDLAVRDAAAAGSVAAAPSATHKAAP